MTGPRSRRSTTQKNGPRPSIGGVQAHGVWYNAGIRKGRSGDRIRSENPRITYQVNVISGPREHEWEVRQAAAMYQSVTSPTDAEVIPVAFLGRTSSAELQDPTLSIPRQLTEVREKLPPG